MVDTKINVLVRTAPVAWQPGRFFRAGLVSMRADCGNLFPGSRAVFLREFGCQRIQERHTLPCAPNRRLARKDYHDKKSKEVCHGMIFLLFLQFTMRKRKMWYSHGTNFIEVNWIAMIEALVRSSHGIKWWIFEKRHSKNSGLMRN